MGIFEFDFHKRASSNKVYEDELTSRVFGLLEISGKEILSAWLNIKGLKKIEYWPKYPGVDPDLLIQDRSGKELVVECKLSDLGSVDQIKREYKLAYKKLKGHFIFITANISRPEILTEAEKELGLKEGKINWTTWMNLYSIVRESLNYEDIDPVKKHLLTQLNNYLRWLRMGYNFGELMEKFKKAFDEGWLDIASEKFEEFVKELRRAFVIEIKKETKYRRLRVSDKIKIDLFGHTWINLYSKKLEKVDEKLYYYIYFSVKDFQWWFILAGETKPVRKIIRDFLVTQPDLNFSLKENLSGGHDISYRIIASNPNFKKPNDLKKEIIDKSLEFINEMDLILSRFKPKKS